MAAFLPQMPILNRVNYQYPSFLVKDLYKDNQNKNYKSVRYINETLINIRKSFNSKEIPEKENPKKLVNIIYFIKQQKGERLKILTLKKMLQRLPIALKQARAGNTSENLPNEIGQTIYFLYEEKEVTKKVYNNIMNSIKI